MSRVAKTYLRGLLLPHARLTAWDAQSGEYSSGGTRLQGLQSAGARPGTPQPQTPTDVVLEASGAMDPNTQLEVAVQAAGHPGEGATVRWRYTGDTSWRGWDPPTTITHWEPIEWTSASGDDWRYPHAITLPDETVLVAAQSGSTSITVSVWRRDPDTGAWSEVVVTSSLGVLTYGAWPCLVRITTGPTAGRVCCYYWREVAGGSGTTANIAMSYSDDDGASWTLGSVGVLTSGADDTSTDPVLRDGWPTDATTGYDHRRIRVAERGGQWALVTWLRANDTGVTARETIVQYASVDGANFLEVWRTDPALNVEAGAYPEVVAVEDGFLFAWIVASSGFVGAFKAGTAYDPISVTAGYTVCATDAWGTLTGALVSSGDLAMAAAPEGDRVHLTGRFVASQAWVLYRSGDNGETWSAMGASPTGTADAGTWWNAQDTGTYPTDATITWCQGRILVVHSHVSTPASYDESLSATFLGGASTVTMPPISPIAADAKRASYLRTWLPFDLPSDVGWTGSTTGAPTVGLGSGYLALATGVGDAQWYSVTPTGTIGHGVIAVGALRAGTGTAELLVRHYEGGEGYEARVTVSGTTVSVYDTVATSLLGTDTATADDVAVLVALQGSSVRVWIRAWSSAADRAWTLVVDDTLTDDAGATFTASRLRIGSPASSLSRFHFAAYVDDNASSTYNYVGENLIEADFPDDLLGRNLTSVPTWLAGGTRVAALAGPAVGGEEWRIETDYAQPRAHLDPWVEPSPRRGWRSADAADFDASCTELRLAWRLDDDGADGVLDEDCDPGSDLFAVYLSGVNCGGIRLDLYYGGAWHTGPTTGSESFEAVRKGNTFRPSPSNTTGGLWRYGEAIGAMLGLYSGSPTAPDYTGRITASTEGVLSRAATTKYPTFTVAEVSASDPTTSDAVIWPTTHLLAVHLSGFARDIRAFRLVIPTDAGASPGEPPEGYYAIGQVVAGPLVVFGRDYDWGRETEVEAGAELLEALDRSRRAVTRGPARGRVTISWTDGADLSDLRSSSAPDYVTGSANSGAAAIAFASDTPLLVQDWHRAHNGRAPVVYVPYLPYDSAASSSGDTAAIWRGRAAGALYSWLVSAVKTRVEVGEEEVSELVSGGSITLEEET